MNPAIIVKQTHTIAVGVNHFRNGAQFLSSTVNHPTTKSNASATDIPLHWRYFINY